jgi:putative SOS response-associated peptidase YedK
MSTHNPKSQSADVAFAPRFGTRNWGSSCYCEWNLGIEYFNAGTCNLYSITTNQAAISALFRVVNRYVGNLAPMPGVFPEYKAPIVRTDAHGRELTTARWGMPSSAHAIVEATKKRAAQVQAKGKPVDFKELLRMEPDGGTTNIRNVKSQHRKRSRPG